MNYAMNHELRKLLMLAMLVVGLGAWAQTKDALKLTLTDGTSTYYKLSDRPVLTFNDGSMHITTPSIGTSYPLADIKEYRFVDATVGIRQPSAGEQPALQVVQEGDDIIIRGMQGSATLYDMAGHQLSVSTGVNSRISLSGRPAGIYIININHQTIKVTKR